MVESIYCNHNYKTKDNWVHTSQLCSPQSCNGAAAIYMYIYLSLDQQCYMYIYLSLDQQCYMYIYLSLDQQCHFWVSPCSAPLLPYYPQQSAIYAGLSPAFCWVSVSPASVGSLHLLFAKDILQTYIKAIHSPLMNFIFCNVFLWRRMVLHRSRAISVGVGISNGNPIVMYLYVRLSSC